MQYNEAHIIPIAREVLGLKKRALLLAMALACVFTAGGAVAENAQTGDAQPAAMAAQYQTLERGAKGEDVRALMQRLADLGYYTSKVDDSFGPGMARAVKLFNAMCGLEGGETATGNTQERAFAQDAPAYQVMPPRITAVALEQYEGVPVLRVQAQNPQEADITFLSVIFRCYDVSGAPIYALSADASTLGNQPRFGKYRDIALACGQTRDLGDVAVFDLSAYPGVSRVEAALYCYQAGSDLLIVPEGNFRWVSSDGTVSGYEASQAEIEARNRTAEQDGLAGRFTLGAQTRHVFGFESGYYALPTGLYISEVEADGCCARAGLQAGDVILSIAGVQLDFEEALYLIKAQMEPDVEYELEYWRAGQTLKTTLSWSEAQAE